MILRYLKLKEVGLEKCHMNFFPILNFKFNKKPTSLKNRGQKTFKKVLSIIWMIPYR